MKKRGKSETLSLTTDTKMKEIIRALWRESFALYNEKYNRAPELDELGQEIDPQIPGSISETVLHGLYLGQDNLIEGNRSAAIGQGLNTKSLLEIVLGTYNSIPENQNPEEWIPTDLLASLGNGTDNENRSNAFEIFKNGIFKLLNAFQLGKWEPGVQGTDPENGTFQWTPENGLEEWRTNQWESFTGANGLSAYQIAVNNGFPGTEADWLISLEGADGAQGEAGPAGADGAQGIQGIQGEQGVPGTPAELPLVVSGITLLSASWTGPTAGFYEYDLSNANITATSVVDGIPAKASSAIIKAAQIEPEGIVTSGHVKFYAVNAPSGNISITIVITEATA